MNRQSIVEAVTQVFNPSNWSRLKWPLGAFSIAFIETKTLILTAACAFGLEAIVKRELMRLGYEPKITQPGRVEFRGDWNAVCRSNLWLRTADRVLIEVQKFEAPDFDALFDTVREFDWSQWIPKNAAFPVIGRSRLSQLTSVPAIQRSVKRALVESLKQFHGVSTLPETGALYKVEIALLNDVATLTLDTTGPSLHKRGYRKLAAAAPLKETLAAALVDLSVWNPERPLVDPFCGSGTIPIEAALIGMNVAPGMHRSFSASQWSAIAENLWHDAAEEARDLQRRDMKLQIVGTDRDAEVLSLARYHSKQAGVADQVHFQHKSFSELSSSRSYGCVVTNPPYGERLEDQKQLIGLYQSIPGIMQRLPTWSLFLITNMPKFESLIQKSATRRRKLFNGRLECTYYQFLGPRPPSRDSKRRPDQQGQNPEPGQPDQPSATAAEAPPENPTSIPFSVVGQRDNSEPTSLPAPTLETESVIESPSEQAVQGDQHESTIPPGHSVDRPHDANPVESGDRTRSKQPNREKPTALFGGLTDKDREQAQLFHNRLVKRARHLRRWPTKRKITCFRLYERDIPEIPLVVDRYEDSLHITEYERPHDRDLARHAAWLELMKKTAAQSLDIPLTQVHLKERRRDQETRQYKKLDSSGKLTTVHEAGLKFLVNLTDYVDTGLFLDHRITRQMFRDESAGKDVLNLFAYTGAFSVYAAAGGADSTTTVDLSKNYLDWAKRNLELNGFDSSSHQFVAEDSINFLETAAEDKRKRFDLAIVDPPTYSNSKRTDIDWDVQTRHVELLYKVHDVMRMGGVVYFSTNFRRFKLDESAIEAKFDFRELSKQTVPEDFRNRRIHRCWRMVVKW